MNDPNAQDPAREATQLLQRVKEGDRQAAEQLLPIVYEELRARAGAYFRNLPANHTLQPTALVHEAYIKLVNSPSAQWHDRAHFCALAARAMRLILTDHARRRIMANKAREQHPTLLESPSENISVDLLALDEALTKLTSLRERLARIIELRFFGSLSMEETAAVLDVSVSTVEKDWRRARAWLIRELGEDKT